MLDAAVTAPYTLDPTPATSALAPDEPAATLPPGPSSTPATPALPAVIGDRAALRAVLARGDLTSSARLTWIALFAHADATSGAAWPSVPTLARETGCAVRTVRYALRALERAGLATPARRPGRSTVYRVHLPRQAPPAPLRLTPARTPARGAPTPARGAGGPRHQVPPERLRERNKELLTRPHARGGTPATVAARTPAGVAPSGPAPAAPTGPTAPATAPGGPIPLPERPSARTTPASPAAIAAQLAAHLAGDTPATRPLASTPATRPGPATVRPDPSGEGDLPGELGATLARLRARIVAGRS